MDNINGLTIKVIRIYKLPTPGPLKALCDIEINDVFVLKGIRILAGTKGLFISMPQEQGQDKRWYDIFKPLTKEAQNYLDRIVSDAYDPPITPMRG